MNSFSQNWHAFDSEIEATVRIVTATHQPSGGFVSVDLWDGTLNHFSIFMTDIGSARAFHGRLGVAIEKAEADAQRDQIAAELEAADLLSHYDRKAAEFDAARAAIAKTEGR